MAKKFHYFLKIEYVCTKKHHKDCALLNASIVILGVCRFYMKCFRVFSMTSVLHVSKIESSSPEIVSSLENKEPLISFRLYGKSAAMAQTDRD